MGRQGLEMECPTLGPRPARSCYPALLPLMATPPVAADGSRSPWPRSRSQPHRATAGLPAFCEAACPHATAAMPTPLTSRLLLAALALLAEALHLGWEALHGGIVTHHVMQRADLPGLSNAWGLLVLPALAAWAAGRLPRAAATRRQWLPVALGFALPLLLGAALALSFHLQWQALTEAVFFGLMLLALLLPAHRPESLFGFVLGMSWTFGAVLPLAVGGVIAGLSWALRGLMRLAWRALRPRALA